MVGGVTGIKREKSINRKQQKAAKNSETLSVAPQLSTAAHLNHITAGFSFFFWSLKVTPSKHRTAVVPSDLHLQDCNGP